MSIYDFKTDRMGQLQARLGRIEDLIPYSLTSSQYAGVQNSVNFGVPSNSSLSNGVIDLTSSGVSVIGSIPPNTNTAGFGTVTASGAGAGTSNIHIYWDGTNGSTVMRKNRADGTSYTVPSGDINVTGLNPSTTYYFLPFWVPSNACTIGWVQGTVGTPQIAFTVNTDTVALAKQNYQGRESLTSGYMSVATPAALGSGGGSPGGGGNPSTSGCVMLGTDIEPLGDLEYRNVHRPCDHWWRVVTKSGRSLNGTPNHPIYHADKGKIELSSAEIGSWLITTTGEDKVMESQPFTRMCTKVETLMPQGHLYWTNGILSHNAKPNLE